MIPTAGLDVLNCNLGDLKLSFDPANPVEADRAKRAVTDMLRRGYVIFIEVDGKLVRVKRFDESKCEYIITDAPGSETYENQNTEAATETSDSNEREPEVEIKKPKGKRGRPRGVPAAGTKATAIAPRAGG